MNAQVRNSCNRVQFTSNATLKIIVWLPILIMLMTVCAGCSERWRPVDDVKEALPGATLGPDVGPFLRSIKTDGQGNLWAVGESGEIIHSASRGSHWDRQESNLRQDLNAIAVNKDGKRLWIVGSNMTILFSTNSGAIWSRARVPKALQTEEPAASDPQFITSELYAVCGTDDDRELWTVGDGGTILHSTDGGIEWESQVSGTEQQLIAIACNDGGAQLWIAGTNGVILHSIDHGHRWKLEPTRPRAHLLDIFTSADGKTMWISGTDGTLLRSGNVGRSWQTLYTGLRTTLMKLWVDETGTRLRALGGNGLLLEESDDSGKTWTDQRLPAQIGTIFGTSKLDELWLTGENSKILRTSDAGKNWETILGGPAPTKLSHIFHKGELVITDVSQIVASANGEQMWAVGPDIYHSSDGGNSWNTDYTPSDQTGPLRSIWGSQDLKSLWAVSLDGLALRHSSGPLDWSPQDIGTQQSLNKIEGTPDGKTIWAVGWNGIIVHSMDAGLSWRPQESHTKEYLTSIWVGKDGTHLVATGLRGVILHSNDGGNTWIKVESGVESNIAAIWGVGAHLWAVGDNGTILSSRDIGQNWKQEKSGTNEYLTAVWGTPDGKRIWALANRRQQLLQSSGRGDWTVLQLPTRDSNLGAEGGALGSVPGDPTQIRFWIRWDIRDHPSMIFGHSHSANLPLVKDMRVTQGISEFRLDLRLKRDVAKTDGAFVAELDGANEFDLRQHQIKKLSIVSPLAESPNILSYGFDPKRELGAFNGGRLFFTVTLMSGGIRRTVKLPAVTFDQWAVVRQQSSWVLPVLVAGAVELLFTGVLFTYPLLLLKIQAFADLLLDRIPSTGVKGLLAALFKVTVIPFFATHSRTLDAWVEKHYKDIQQRFDTEECVRTWGAYAPLPIRIERDSTDTLLQEPTTADFSQLFDGNRVLLEIVGPGGSGKTTVAGQIGRLGFKRRVDGGLLPHRVIPVLIQEETSDLFETVKRKLQSWTDQDISQQFIAALIRRKRVILLVDRLSERSDATIRHVTTIHGTKRVGVLATTSRSRLEFEAGGSVVIRPQPLDSRALLFFMAHLLESTSNANAFSSLKGQVSLGMSLAELTDVEGERKEAPLTPLLVRMYVKKAVSLVRSGEPLDNLPKSIPDIYFDYVRDLNPLTPETRNLMSHEAMLYSAEMIAKLALGSDLIPKEFLRSSARALIASPEWRYPVTGDPIQRLVDNGILIEDETGSSGLLRFALDPVAEFLGAMAWALECGPDPIKWEKLEAQLARLKGDSSNFPLAVRQIVHIYGKRLNWPTARRP